jgi:hypothetical protein
MFPPALAGSCGSARQVRAGKVEHLVAPAVHGCFDHVQRKTAAPTSTEVEFVAARIAKFPQGIDRICF